MYDTSSVNVLGPFIFVGIRLVSVEGVAPYPHVSLT
jgi:hypothetical protein